MVNISSGIARIQEPYNVTVYLMLPFNYSLVLIPSTVFSHGNFYEFLLRIDYVYMVFSVCCVSTFLTRPALRAAVLRY